MAQRKAYMESLFRDTTLDQWNTAIVGCRVKVYWPGSKSWYSGRLIKYRPTKGRHKYVFGTLAARV